MAKKRRENDENKSKPTQSENLKKGKKFSKENQPTPEAKSEGWKKKRTFKEVFEALIDKEITNSKGEKASTIEAMAMAVIKKALSGDIKANEYVRDTLGQKPIDKQEVKIDTPIIKDDI